MDAMCVSVEQVCMCRLEDSCSNDVSLQPLAETHRLSVHVDGSGDSVSRIGMPQVGAALAILENLFESSFVCGPTSLLGMFGAFASRKMGKTLKRVCRRGVTQSWALRSWGFKEPRTGRADPGLTLQPR